MKRYVETPFYLVELSKDEFDIFMRKIIGNEIRTAVQDFMEANNVVPKHIEICEKPRTMGNFELEISREPKTGMFKYRGELVSYGRMCEIIADGEIKSYEIEVY